ncbi:MAG: hypothetical protein WKG01_21405 [Kofleriaceae bacterium]
MTRAWLALVLACASTAQADTPRATPQAIEVDRAEALPARNELGFDGGAPLATWGVAISGSWLEHPIELAGTRPVRRRQTASLGAALALGSIVLDGRLAIAHQVGDRLAGLGDTTPLARSVLGDLRLGARIRVTGSPSRAVFVRADLALPTGNAGQFAGDASWSVAWRLIGRVTLPHDIVVAATAGIRLRGVEVLVGERLLGDELLGAIGVAIPLPPVRPLWCVADQVKLTAEVGGVLGDDVGAGRGRRRSRHASAWSPGHSAGSRSARASAPASTIRSARHSCARCSSSPTSRRSEI